MLVIKHKYQLIKLLINFYGRKKTLKLINTIYKIL